MSEADPSQQGLTAQNPATGADLEPAVTSPIATADRVVAAARALRAAQTDWAAAQLRERRASIRRWHAIIARDTRAWAQLIAAEIGKPRVEALVEVATTLDAIKWTFRRAPGVLRTRRAWPRWQRALLMKPARMELRPHGLVGLIGTWNYPLLLNAAPLAQALVAGNTVLWKPSELATACGARLHASLEEAGLAPAVAETVFGPGAVGEMLLESGIDKCVFTGGIEVGRRVLGALGARGIPAVAELSGFDAAIVLPDAPMESTARALAWAAFVGAGQTCVSVKRICIVGDERPWVDSLARVAESLRIGDPSCNAVDMGPLISARARQRVEASVGEALAAGAEVATGAHAIEGPGHFYAPTVLRATSNAPERALEGVFGPVVIVRGFASIDEAVAAANESSYGLSASVWGRNRRQAHEVGRRLNAGMVTINDAVTPAGHACAPFGGAKSSGYGRTRGIWGLREFVHPVAIHDRGAGGWRPQLFPYDSRLEKLLGIYRWLFHRAAR